MPPRREARKLLPVIVFISPTNEPMGWKRFENLCKQRGILFAGLLVHHLRVRIDPQAGTCAT